ncbi:MAG: crotonase/enoyl-CoA hydratase family protein [Caulobacterales bacterium]|nr:crotonase/enoyl-CoA hydratase family protein [Caulobacterales bacterium]
MNGRVSITLEDGVAHVRLTRAEKMNALDPEMIEALAAAIDRLAGMAGLRAVVLSGDGRAFCAGLDMASMAGLAGSDFDIMARTHGPANIFQQVCWGWRSLAVPVIAAVHGVAYGGGLQLMSGADIRLVRPDTRLSVMEMKWGIVPDMAGFALWSGLVQDDILRELIYTAREFSGEAAVWLGFATRTAEDPVADALSLAREIAVRNPEAIRAAKRLANLALQAGVEEILLAESREQGSLIGTPNQMEAVAANLQKRAPDFAD